MLLDRENAREALRARALSSGVELCSLDQLIVHSDYVLSTVTTQVAKQVAADAASKFRNGQVYIDLNSTSPAVKVELGRIVAAAGADFVEGAILGAVGAAVSRAEQN